MEYGLAKMVISSTAWVPIEPTDYDSIREAKAGLLEGLSLEEKWDLVVENYLELETTLLDASARHMILGGDDYRSFQLERATFNRRIVNLLTAGRTYIDHAPQHVDRVLGSDSPDSQAFRAKFKEQYDARLGYRAIDALRNYVQHRGFPVHSWGFNAKWLDPPAYTKSRHTAHVNVRPDELRSDGMYKKSVLAELEAIGDRVDLMPLTRDYLEGLWVVQHFARSILRGQLEDWEATLRHFLNLFETATSEEPRHLAAYERTEEGRRTGQLQIFLDSVDYRHYLERKNVTLAKLRSRFVSSETVDDWA